MNLSALVELLYNHITETPTVLQLVLSTFVTFVIVFRWNIQRHLRYKVFTRCSESKILNCETCFGFWLCLLISTNLTTAAAAYLLYNFYEQKN